MVRKEDLNDFNKIFDEKQRIVRANQANEIALRQNELREKQKKIEAIHKQIIDTGVVDLMQNITNMGRVRGLKEESDKRKFIRAEIVLSNDTPEAVMKFNKCAPSGHTEWDEVYAVVNNGILTIKGQEKYIVNDGMSMGKALGLATINPIHNFIPDSLWS